MVATLRCRRLSRMVVQLPISRLLDPHCELFQTEVPPVGRIVFAKTPRSGVLVSLNERTTRRTLFLRTTSPNMELCLILAIQVGPGVVPYPRSMPKSRRHTMGPMSATRDLPV